MLALVGESCQGINYDGEIDLTRAINVMVKLYTLLL
jgi:hypothetical protein